jgi:hypothetical protein
LALTPPRIKDPVIDELIELVITAPTRESLIACTRALVRVLQQCGQAVCYQFEDALGRF